MGLSLIDGSSMKLRFFVLKFQVPSPSRPFPPFHHLHIVLWCSYTALPRIAAAPAERAIIVPRPSFPIEFRPGWRACAYLLQGPR